MNVRNVLILSLAVGLVERGSLLAEEWQVGNFNLLTDYVYMQRYHVKNKPLAVNTAKSGCHGDCPSNRVLDTKDLVHGTKPGMHIALSYLPDVKSAYELGALYLWAMDNSSTRTRGHGILSVPFSNPSFASSFTDVDRITSRYKSLFYTAELNYIRTFSYTRNNYLALTGIFGFRFADISEKFSLDAFKRGKRSSYDISAANHLAGIQVGFDLQIHPTRRFYWDLLVKGGAALNQITADIFLGNHANKQTLRNYTKQPAQGGMFAEAAAGLGCQLLDWLNMHAGYQMLFFGGLALAPNQISYSSNKINSTSSLSSHHIGTNSYVVIHGMYAGMTFSF